jgi:hypothetical protein
MATKKSPISPAAQAALDAANAAAGGKSKSTSGISAALAAPVDNTQLGLKDANGKPLPSTITGQQFKDAISNTKYNGAVIESLKSSAARYIPGGASISPTGQVSPTEVNAITNFLTQGYYNTSINTPIKILDTIKGIKDGSLDASANASPWTVPSTISRTSFDQPNIEASKATINDVFLGLLGRTASDKEIQQYTQKFLSYAAKNPTTTSVGANNYSTISVPTSSGTPSSRLFRGSQTETSTSNNLTEQAFLQNQVKSTGEYNAFTAAGSAFDMMTKMAQKDTGAM